MSNGVKMPERYRQQERERERERNIRLAAALGYHSRHLEDPEGSEVWVKTGVWPEEKKL